MLSVTESAPLPPSMPPPSKEELPDTVQLVSVNVPSL